MPSAPLVSVVTPFYNTRQFLGQCIESILGQTFQDWEYVLVNNCSTDGSEDLVASYVSRFPAKMRLVHTGSFLTQVENYNFALTCIAPTSRYCKVVQADDWLFPACLANMVEIGEAHPSVGIVSAYELEGENVSLDGLPYPSPETSGREVARRYFLERRYLFGTPTSILMRSELVRSRTPFYDARFAPFEDAHVCFDVMKSWNLGFVHQVLTYSRRGNESIILKLRARGFLHFSRLSFIVMHGRDFLSPDEHQQCLRDAERRYFLYLGKRALGRKIPEFWELHRKALASINYELRWTTLARWMPRALVEKVWEAFWSRVDEKSTID